MISALVLRISKSDCEARWIFEIDASKDDIVGVLLQVDAFRSLRCCIYGAKIINGCGANYNAYGCEALVLVETVSWVLTTRLTVSVSQWLLIMRYLLVCSNNQLISGIISVSSLC
jgi:hypothetical protein